MSLFGFAWSLCLSESLLPLMIVPPWRASIVCYCRALLGLEGESKNLDRLALPCPLTGIEEGV